MCLVLFFKQKTAYEMRISDWSSDVCSSDLQALENALNALIQRHEALRTLFSSQEGEASQIILPSLRIELDDGLDLSHLKSQEQDFQVQEQIGRAPCRERVCQYV